MGKGYRLLRRYVKCCNSADEDDEKENDDDDDEMDTYDNCISLECILYNMTSHPSTDRATRHALIRYSVGHSILRPRPHKNYDNGDQSLHS